MSPTVKRFSVAAAVLVLAGCMSQTSEGAKKEARGLFAMVDTAGASGRDSVRVYKLHCTSSQSHADSLTVLRNDPDTALVVDGHRLEIPSGAVPRGSGTTFRMAHLANGNELRVVLETVPEIKRFDRRLSLSLSYESCDTAGVDLERVQLLRNDRQLRGGRHEKQRRRVRAELPDLSTYTLAAPS